MYNFSAPWFMALIMDRIVFLHGGTPVVVESSRFDTVGEFGGSKGTYMFIVWTVPTFEDPEFWTRLLDKYDSDRVIVGCDVRACPDCWSPLSFAFDHYFCRTCKYEASRP